MKRYPSLLCAAFIVSLSACGSNEQANKSVSTPPAGPPTTNLDVTINGPRNNYNIIRKQTSTLVIDKNNSSNVIDVSTASSVTFSDLHVNLTIASRLQLLNDAQVQSLIELYIAFFNRTPDADGIVYWMDQLAAGKTISQIADSFYQAGIQTSTYTGYTKDMSDADFVRLIYKNVLGRTGPTAPTDGEVAYWVSDLQSGRQTKSSVVSTMLTSARTFANDPQFGWVTRLLNNKIEVGRYVALQQSISFIDAGNNILRGMQIATAVTADDSAKAKSLLGVDDPQFNASLRAPSEPQNIVANTKSQPLSFSFDAPKDNGGTTISTYTASCKTDGTETIATSNASPISFSTLSMGKTYLCAIKASNAYGDSAYTTPVSVSLSSGSISTAFNGDIVLGSPSNNSIRIKILSASQSGLASIAYGTSASALLQTTSTKSLIAGSPLEFQLENLPTDSQIFYAINFQSDPSLVAAKTTTYDFHTARGTGTSFSFTIQADSHLDENSNLAQYQRTLDNILIDRPDFHIDLGDTFMTEKHTGPFDPVVKMATSQTMVDTRYIYERQHFGRITHSTPLFLANGNHEGELGWLNDGTANNLAVWANLARQKFYANPMPTSFYSGDTSNTNFLGNRASWYAWQWGDALFVVLDPYWNTKIQASKDAWNMSLGSTQYQWLNDTLSKSSAKYKFIFLHNLVGGLDGQMRGGVEAAPFYEWGGKNSDGSYGFDQKRPGWGLPIHQLLVKNKVTAVFHGHDHVYVRQTLDGIVYQEVPQPSAANNTSGANLATEYHYLSGIVQSSSGHIRVTVTPQGVKSEYVRSWLPANETSSRKNRQIDDSWTINP